MTSDATVEWQTLLAEAQRRLDGAGIDNAATEARWIVESASGLEYQAIIASTGDAVTHRQMAHFDSMVGRRLAGEPLQYVLGHWSFRTLDLAVDRRALIPRSETEFLVEVALTHVDRAAADHTPVMVADLGTGTGAIALSVASERMTTRVWATDDSPDALALARANLAGLGRPATRVQLAVGSWFEALPGDLVGSFDVLVSNPPYIGTSELIEPVVSEWEPPTALFSGPDGLHDLTVIVAGAPRWLAPDGALVVECGTTQGESVAALFEQHGFDDVVVRQDLAGRDRVVEGKLT